MYYRGMKISPEKIKDIERLQKYERIFQKLLKNEIFSKQDIWDCGEGKGLIGKIINILLDEGSIVQQAKGTFQWMPSSMESYKEEWITSVRPSHQLKRLKKEERPREKLITYGSSKLTTSELLAIFLRSGI